MALVRCSECGKEISSDAKICPNCGKPTEAKAIQDQAVGSYIGWLIGGGIALVLMIVGIVKMTNLSAWDIRTNSTDAVLAFVCFFGGMICSLVCDIQFIVKSRKIKQQRAALEEKNQNTANILRNRTYVNPIIGKENNQDFNTSTTFRAGMESALPIIEPANSDISDNDEKKYEYKPARYCSYCGTQLDMAAIFCGQCGNKIK